MSETWQSLYLRAGNHEPGDPSDIQTVSTALLGALQQLGYERYDPFAGGTGTPPGLKTFIRQFVVPASDGWLRVLGEPDLRAVADLSRQWPVLRAWLTDANSGIELYRDGQIANENLAKYLRSGKSASDLQRAEAGNLPVAVDPGNSVVPAEMQQLAREHNVNPEQANKMIDRLSSRLFGKLDRASGGEDHSVQAQARALATGANRLDWNSAAATRLKALVSVLDLPPNWRDPDFETVRSAYQAARYLRKNPKAQLMPDELAALKALPDAIQYEAIYVGKASPQIAS